MDCDYILEHDLHEQYILSQIEESDRERYEHHLETCESCRVELENQRQIILALKETGRMEMKKEIRRQLERSRAQRRDIDWAKLSKIAAVLLIAMITPVIYYYVQRDKPELLTVSAPLPVVQNSPAEVASVPPPGLEKPSQIAEAGVASYSGGDQLPESQPSKKSKNAAVSGQDRAHSTQPLTFSIAKPDETHEPLLWRFVYDDHVFQVYVKERIEEEANGVSYREGNRRLPAVFPVEILNRDSTGMEMIWMVREDFAEVSPIDIRIELAPDEIIRVVVEDSLVYRIDLRGNPVRAVLETE